MISARSHPGGVPAVVGFAGVLGITLVVLNGTLIRLAWQNRPTPIDVWWHDLMASYRNGVADAVAQFLNTFGGTLWMTLVTASIVAVLLVARKWRLLGDRSHPHDSLKKPSLSGTTFLGNDQASTESLSS